MPIKSTTSPAAAMPGARQFIAWDAVTRGAPVYMGEREILADFTLTRGSLRLENE